MASAVHAVALRSKQAKKKKLLDQLQVQQQLGGRNPSIVGLPGATTGRAGLDPAIRSVFHNHCDSFRVTSWKIDPKI